MLEPSLPKTSRRCLTREAESYNVYTKSDFVPRPTLARFDVLRRGGKLAGWLVSVMQNASTPDTDYLSVVRTLIPEYGGTRHFGGDVIGVVDGDGSATWISAVEFPTPANARALVESADFQATLGIRSEYYKRTIYLVGEPTRNLQSFRGAPHIGGLRREASLIVQARRGPASPAIAGSGQARAGLP